MMEYHGRIIYSAIRKESKTFVGKRHSDAFAAAKAAGHQKPWTDWEQGFVTADQTFLDRMEAMPYAVRIGQVKPGDLCDPKHGLFSEDLW